MIPAPVVLSPSSRCPDCRSFPVRFGSYKRSSDQAIIQRYRCRGCRRTFSDATSSECYREKKRQFNGMIVRLFTGGYSQRRMAFDLGLNRKTVVRKFLRIGKVAEKSLVLWNLYQPKVSVMQFDDLETAIHSKCLPASITLAVEKGTRRILGFRVSQMPAKGVLANISRAKYGLPSITTAACYRLP